MTAGLWVLLACAARPPAADPQPSVSSPATSATPAFPQAPRQDVVRHPVIPEPEAAASRGEPILVVTDPKVLVRLEELGMAIGPLVFGGGTGRIASFRHDPGYVSIRRQLQRDVRRRLSGDSDAGVGPRFRHRAYDTDWLDSDKTRMELVAVVNRIDRRVFDASAARCGELRFIYRLAYATTLEDTAVDSRLPMTVNVVFWQPGDSCAEVARRWFVEPGLSGAALADALHSGPLAHASGDNLEAVEVNLQMLRWPGVVHPSLGGNTEYELRVFKRESGVSQGAFVPTPLENTPDVSRIAARPALQQQLRTWIGENLEGLEQGTAMLPDALSTDVAVSVTPRALARLANRPFSQLLRVADFESLELTGFDHIRSPAALLRRLDTLSCQGCHATRSVAGFHVVGEPRDPTQVLDAVAVPTSAHLHGDVPRRRAYLIALANGQRVDETRPLPDFDPERGYGAQCGLGDPGFAHLRCAAPLSCVKLDDDVMGTCLPQTLGIGDPCEMGELRTHAIGYRDRVRDTQIASCAGGAVCNVNRMGFPGGMCTSAASGLSPDAAVGPIVDFTTFNRCVGRRRPFPKCIEKAAHPVGLRGCDETDRCRDDYVCASSPYGDRGVCLPPYFLFQLRVDGHVL